MNCWSINIATTRRMLVEIRLRTAVAVGIISMSLAFPQHAASAEPEIQEKQAQLPAFDINRYVGQLEHVLSARVVPALSRAIVAHATTRPTSMDVRLVREASPYQNVAMSQNGRLVVSLSLGYALAHDAALDGAGLAATFNRPFVLENYLQYQVAAARENERRRSNHTSGERLATFAEFASLPPGIVRSTFADARWHAERSVAQEASLGWVISYLLVSASPGLIASEIREPSRAAAELVAQAGWFPVPPMATAFGWAEFEGGVPRNDSLAGIWCRAADFMRSGVEVAQSTSTWRPQGDALGHAEKQLAAVTQQVERLQRRFRCNQTDSSKVT